MLVPIGKRNSLRLSGWDYTHPGGYFITVCAHEKGEVFGKIIDGKMKSNRFGQTIVNEWLRSQQMRAEIELDEYVVMPDHFHGIVWIKDMGTNGNVGANGRSPLPTAIQYSKRVMRPRSLSSFISGFKSLTTKQINIVRKTPGARLWQRNYYDHIIRDTHDLSRIRDYIRNNPLSYGQDFRSPNKKSPA